MTQSQRLKKALLKGTKELNKLKIPYVITGGTLLGIYRGGELLEHDRDVDVDILEEDVGDTKKFLKKLEKVFPGCIFHNNYFTAQIKVDSGEAVPFDMFIVFNKGKKRFRWFDGIANTSEESPCLVWPEHFYYKDRWEKIKFAGRWFPTPADIEDYLVIFFGEDWQQPKNPWSWTGGAKNNINYKDIKWIT